MSPTGMDVILYEYVNQLNGRKFEGELKESFERLLTAIYTDEYSSPDQDYERAREAIEIQF